MVHHGYCPPSFICANIISTPIQKNEHILDGFRLDAQQGLLAHSLYVAQTISNRELLYKFKGALINHHNYIIL